MSLDVSLYTANPIKKVCSCCDSEYEAREQLFTANITHNLNKMAEAVGLYDSLWYPKPGTLAKNIILPLEIGIKLLKSKPEHYKQYSASNGWGTYEQFIPWLETYLEACKEHPDAVVEVSR